ncbi:response regulator transcription factor [Hydrogenibacillus schlegelii]|uniref:DNA-binding response regulator ResD n=1 Tax=Hydrogenibacillus schlegelii TaxID=1484 RepID=A0A132MFR9_HYDSH|nr:MULTISPECIES: response regulator transcription factor [Hydrogenibacillus]KWW96690.1 transcriptional regulator [Hydrogenibacillus schlegelii]MBE3563673.1 response regulator transcription factor [Hydrogenibacillus schlegelii]MBT9281927.1 response regulator transcription factor [Hydrogenibacillus schlegelii]OAR05309.1 two-component system response regulator [Hydrogenibacillus schlegelii]PTQ54637.1 MAG: DNA-binding response regulator ResD [Hydrogenibacillus schlegelii]
MNEKRYRLLIVDDEERIRRLLKMYFMQEPYDIDEADNGVDALRMALEHDYDVILLDLMLPGMDGIEVAERLRDKKATPIIMITAKGDESSRIKGFEAGADDYVTKPFSPREVVMRVRAILKRASATAYLESMQQKEKIILPHITIDHTAHRVVVDGKEVQLRPKEYDLLYYLAQSPDRVFTREQLLKDVWQYDYFGDLRTVDTHIKRLREKLKEASPEAARMIVTVWGVGYKLEVPQA